MSGVILTQAGVPAIVNADGRLVPLTHPMKDAVVAELLDDPELAPRLLAHLWLGVSAIVRSYDDSAQGSVDDLITEINPLLLINEFTAPAYVLANAQREAAQITAHLTNEQGRQAP